MSEIEITTQPTSEPVKGQFELLRQRRFAALFHTQFLGAFNDNVFKSALSLIFVYSGLIAVEATDIFVNLAAGLFVLPFFLFSATAGQLADKYEKSRLVRLIKIFEILIALAGGVAVYFQSVSGMLVVLFLLGVQSTFFGPLKYSILPQHLHETELVGGNAQIEMGTFVAILLGTLFGGIIVAQGATGWVLSAVVVGVALLGYFASRFIPETPSANPNIRVGLNPIPETIRLFKLAAKKRSVLLAMLGISWFWLLGGAFLTQIPNLTRESLFGDSTVVTLVLTIFTLAIAMGSLACERLSGHKIELGLVPFGAMGLSIAGIDLYFSIEALTQVAERNWLAFLGADGSLRLMIDLAFIGLFGGLFIVPLYALIQARTAVDERARIIAANNVFNAVMMVLGAILAILLIGLSGVRIPDFLFTLILMNVAVTWFIFHQVPEFGMRFLVWLLSHTMYRVRHEGLENVPEEGGALIVANHVTYVDALLLAGAVRRPIRFIMHKSIFDIPVLNYVFRVGGAIPITSKAEDPETYEAALKSIAQGLEEEDLLCIFPEGALTRDGEVAEFRKGTERIVAANPVPVIPMALRGLWGSFFSHDRGPFKWPKRFWSKVDVVAGAAIAPENVAVEQLRQRVLELRADQP